MAFPLPDKPSIAVLPFNNMSNDPKQEYICDGFTEQIITSLSKISGLFVIARNSSFSFKGKAIKVQHVAEQLGVRYILEGTIQKTGEKVRITSQLIDSIAGHHLWAETYDRELKDIFALQDEITLKILSAIGAELTKGERARIYAKGTKNLEAYITVVKGYEHFERTGKEENLIARKLAREAIELDSKYPSAYGLLGGTYLMDPFVGSTDSSKKSWKEAVKAFEKTLTLDETHAPANGGLAFVYGCQRQYDKALIQAQRTRDLNPGIPIVQTGYVLVFVGRYDEAVEFFKKTIRHDPKAPTFYHLGLGHAYRGLERYREAIAAYEKAFERDPDYFMAHVFLAATYNLAGREEEARAEAAEVLRLQPKFSLDRLAKTLPYKDKDYLNRAITAMRKAGLPEYPPPQLPDKPSIAVLAFDNLSGDLDQEYISDGLAENIITALSKVGELFIIARNSSFTYKGKPVKVQQIGRELGVRYVLEGSVQKSKDRLRITAQLVDVINGRHLWAESYYRDVKDIFDIQDEITKKIVTSLLLELSEGDQARIREKQSKTLEGFLKMAQATSLWRIGSEESLIRFGQLAQEFNDLEPESSAGYRLLGWYHWGLAARGISPHPREEIKKSHTFALKAVSVDESDSLSHGLLGATYRVMKNYEKAIESSKRAVELDPNGAMVRGLLGQSYYYAGQLDKALVQLKQAIRLNPFPASWYYAHLGLIYRQKGQYEDAIREFKNAIKRSPNHYMNYIGLATVYVFSNQIKEAEAAAKKILELYPDFSVKRFSKALSYKQAEKSAIVEALRKSGLPE